MINPYHLNLWSPRQWQHALSRYFGRIEPYLHGIQRIGTDFEMLVPAELIGLTEKSFVFEPSSAEDLGARPTLTAVFVVSQPHPAAARPPATPPLTFIDGSFTRPAGYIDPAKRRRLRRQFDRFQPPPPKDLSLLQKTIIIGREQGLWALAKAILTYPQRLWRSLRRR